MYAWNIRTLFCQCVQVNKNVHQTLRAKYSTGSHYDTLNLKSNCTAKDIRDSFVKFSKENHPDASENSKQNADRFRAIMEAYRVLGKAESRAVYDSVMNHEKGPYAVYNYNEPSPSQSHKNQANYYGPFGSKRISNRKIVVYCIIFMVVGAIVQALAIRQNGQSKNHSKARADAEKYGNDYQLEQLAQKSTRK